MTEKFKMVTAIGVVVITCMAIGTFGWMSIHGIDTRQFLYFFATSIGPTIALLWNNHKTGQVADKVDVIEENTNGKLSERIHVEVAKALQENLKDELLEPVEETKA